MSLIECGIGEVTKRDNLFQTTVNLPNAFYNGDRISIEAVGSATNQKGAKEDCVQKVMSLLLAIAPEKVHLHPNFFSNGAVSIQLLVDEARKAHLELFDREESPLNASQFTLIEIHHKFPKARSRPLAISTAQKQTLASYYKPPVNEFEQKELDEEIVQILFFFVRTTQESEK